MARGKIIFLDVDEVLNSQDYRELFPKAGTKAIDPIALQRLEILLQATDAAVVLSSTWRQRWPLPDLQLYLYHQGMSNEVTHRFIGCTPKTTVAKRGHEISTWLRYAPPVQSFVILDDGSDMEPYMDRLVQVNPKTGLQDEHVLKAVQMLREVPTS